MALETTYNRAEMIQRNQSLIDQGWIWNDDLRRAVPPRTDEKGLRFYTDFHADQLAKGYVWNQQCGNYIPPTWTQADVDREMAARKKSAALAGNPSSGGLPDWLLIGFLLLFGLLVFGQNPFVGIVLIGGGIAGWRLTYGKH